MQPFKLIAGLDGLRQTYPGPDALAEAIRMGRHSACDALARLWLSEGIPYVFKNHPHLYESIREWIGQRLLVHPKEVTLIGSARIGYSLAPNSIGRPFSPKSDLDLAIVSVRLLEKVKQEFESWSFDYQEGRVKPSAREKRFWDENLGYGSRILKWGYIDSKLIPLRDRYKTAQTVAQTMYLLNKKLEISEHAPQVRTATVRIYIDWQAFTRRVSTNLLSAFLP